MRIGIRWWLTAACAVVAAVTAVVVSLLAAERSQAAFRNRAQEYAAGVAFGAALDLARDSDAAAKVDSIASARRISLWLFDNDGNLKSAARSRHLALAAVPDHEAAVAAAIRDRRFVATSSDVRATTLGLPLANGALVVYAPHPELKAGVGIVRGQLGRAALFGVLAGGVVGFTIATLTARRLRKIAVAARAIERGDFDIPLDVRFGDEVGELATTIGRMRGRLKESITALQHQHERLQRLLERLQEGIIAVNVRGEVQYANGVARRMLASPLAAGDPLPDAWRQLSLPAFHSELASGTEVVERRVERRDDEAFVVAGVPARDPGDSAVIVITDVSERERRERAERQFVTNAAHELRTPITTIMGAVDVLLEEEDANRDDRKRFLEHIATASRRLERLTNSLLVLARVQTGEQQLELDPVALAPLLSEIAAELTPKDSVSVSVECDADVSVLADRELLRHALINLAANAARHTGSGRIVLSAGADGETVTIELRDTGSGIAASEQERIFDRFYRGQRGSNGFGLGLAIVRQAVAAQGGQTEIESIAGVGTTARIVMAKAR